MYSNPKEESGTLEQPKSKSSKEAPDSFYMLELERKRMLNERRILYLATQHWRPLLEAHEAGDGAAVEA